MKRIFRRLPLPAKLMIIAVVPLAMLIYFALEIVQEKNDKLSVLNNYQARTEQVALISRLLEAMQTERRYSFGYAIKKDWQNEMVNQRSRTDEHIRSLREYSDLGQRIVRYSFLDSLASVRKKIDQDLLAPMDVMNFYTNSIFRMNTLNNVSVGNIRYLDPVAEDLAAQKLLSEMITYLGIARANLYYMLFTKNMNQQMFEGIQSIMLIYGSFENEMRDRTSAAIFSEYQNLLQSGSLGESMRVFNSLLQGQLSANYDAEDFWDHSAAGIDQIMALQRKYTGRVQTGMSRIIKEERESRNRSLVFLIAAIALVIFLVVYTISIITRSLDRLNQAARKIAIGETGLSIQSESDDVIGSLAESIILVDENNRKIANAAHAIGSGNFDVEVVPRSNQDNLGNAILTMKEELKQYHHENDQKMWIHEGLQKVNDAVSGEKNLDVLVRDVLHAVSDYLGAETALAYVVASDKLHYTAGYAVVNEEMLPREIRQGETLMGLAWQKKEVLVIDDIPADFFKIGSGSGNTLPRHLLLVPMCHYNQVEAVFELGSLQPFNRAARQFLEQVNAAVAVSIQMSRNRMRLQELLEETQSQAEELQAQHTELENINTELEAQAQKLQASEEELKVQQEELMQANQELEERSRLLEEKNQLISERNLEIQKKAEELELSSRYKSEFLANMSHELRTPLNSILLLSRLLAENKESNLSQDQVQYAEVIQTSGRGLLNLIDDILDLSKIEAGKMEVELQQVSLSEVVHDMEQLFAPLAAEKNLQLEMSVESGLPSRIETDKLRLEQIIKNLLSNALKFTTAGSVSLKVHSLPANPSMIAFAVRDTGIGIPGDKQQQVFEAFQQADGSTRRKFGGTGLGLSISRELARLLGGEIKLESEPGVGSEFTLYIPVSSRPAQKETAVEKMVPPVKEAIPEKSFRVQHIPESVPDDRAAIAGEDKTILIIEDDTAFSKALVDYTHAQGYKALAAVRGDEGIELARQFRPAGILLDIQLPVKDGWEVMEELKKDPATKHIPVHIMSSHHVKRESLVKGAIDFINKPMAFEQMQEVFKRIETAINKENRKVLIIEENTKHAKALALFLENFDVNAQISASIQNGMEALKKQEVDCVILDMGIPDEQAYKLMEEMKGRQEMENVPVIVFTGKSYSKTEESRIRQYADTIVLKTANSYQRILDEVSLFLHLVEENRKEGKKTSRKLGNVTEVLAGKKILIADDDVRNIFSLSRALEAHEIEVVSAVDGKEALQKLEQHPDTDLVLMDIMMPEMDGYEAMERIRKLPAYRNLPIIAVTAKAMTGDREKCIRSGASDYISKPVDIDQLVSLLRVWLYDKEI